MNNIEESNFSYIKNIFESISNEYDFMNDLITVYPLASVWQVVTFIPSMAVGVRRMHDINRSGFWLLFLLLPLIGWLLIMIFAVLKGNDDDNDYGSPNLSPI